MSELNVYFAVQDDKIFEENYTPEDGFVCINCEQAYKITTASVLRALLDNTLLTCINPLWDSSMQQVN